MLNEHVLQEHRVTLKQWGPSVYNLNYINSFFFYLKYSNLS